jgi:hypothetical protein
MLEAGIGTFTTACPRQQAGVQAALIEYVKICSLYGVGYYYIPGTDTCIKIGGYVRYEVFHNAPTPGAGYQVSGTTGVYTRHTNTYSHYARWRMSMDVRSQTEYGTLRSYFSAGMNVRNVANEVAGPGPDVSLERAFIQFAGFTFGRADTFFGFYNGAAYGFAPLSLDGSTGPGGLNVAAYTWQFGNGLSATISLEDANPKTAGVVDLSTAGNFLGATFGAGTTSDHRGQAMPDVVGNLRVDQAWGSAQIMGALKQIEGRYYTNAGVAGCGTNVTGCANPGGETGWAIGAGLTLKMPWDARDTLSGVIAYGKGASRYVADGPGSVSSYLHRQGVSVGAYTDAVFANPGVGGQAGQIELTEVWGGTVAFEHYWTPSLRTSWVFGYLDVSYNDSAKAMIRAGNCAAAGGVLTQVSNCNPDYSRWQVASRTMWNPVANLDVGLEIAYQKINTAFAGTAVVAGAQGLATTRYNIEDQGVWQAGFRVQRSFWP